MLNRYTVKSRIEGSNPSVSASFLNNILINKHNFPCNGSRPRFYPQGDAWCNCPQNPGDLMMARTKKRERREWTTQEVRELKKHSKSKTSVAVISKTMKRTPAAL